MKTLRTNWKLHSNTKIRYLRNILLLQALGFSCFLCITKETIFNSNTSYYIAGLLYTATAVFTFNSYIKKGQFFIQITNDDLIVPRLFFSNKKIPICDIKSVEKIPASGITSAVLLGHQVKSATIVERRLFESQDEFLNFADTINILASEVNREASTQARFFLDPRRKLPIIEVFSVIFLLVYIITAEPHYESLEKLAIVNGGFNKQTFIPHQLYRLSSSFFLHFTPIHLGVNILAFSLVGRNVLAIFGNTRFICMFLSTSLAAAGLSFLCSSYDSTIGASGGITGLVGAYIVSWIKYRNQLPSSLNVTCRTMVATLFAQVFFDLSVPGIDLYSHIGGFGGGLIYASLILHKRSVSQTSNPTLLEFLLALILTIGFALGLVYFLIRFISA